MPAPLVYVIEVQGAAEAAAEIRSFSDALKNTGNTAELTSIHTIELNKNTKDVLDGFNNAAKSVFSLYTKYDALEKFEFKIAEAEKNRDNAQRKLVASQADLDALVDRGITIGAEYEAAILRLDAAQRQLFIANEKVSQNQEGLSQQLLQLGLSIIPTVTKATTGAVGALTALGIITKITNTETGSTVFALNTATFSHLTHKAAVVGSTIATQSLSFATKLLQFAMGPVGWIILGVSTFLGLFATNAFGVRDAMNAVGKAVGDALPFLQPLLNTLADIANTLFPQTEKASSEAGQSMAMDIDGLKQKHQDLFLKWQEQDTGIITSAQNVAQVGGENMNRFAVKIDKVADSVVSDARRMEKALSKIGAVDVGGFLADPRGESKSSISASGESHGSITVIINMDSKEIAKYVSEVAGDTIKFV